MRARASSIAWRRSAATAGAYDRWLGSQRWLPEFVRAVYQANFAGFTIWDITDPANPVMVSATKCCATAVTWPKLCADTLRLREGGVGAQYWSVFVESATQKTHTSLHEAMREFDVAELDLIGRLLPLRTAHDGFRLRADLPPDLERRTGLGADVLHGSARMQLGQDEPAALLHLEHTEVGDDQVVGARVQRRQTLAHHVGAGEGNEQHHHGRPARHLHPRPVTEGGEIRRARHAHS